MRRAAPPPSEPAYREEEKGVAVVKQLSFVDEDLFSVPPPPVRTSSSSDLQRSRIRRTLGADNLIPQRRASAKPLRVIKKRPLPRTFSSDLASRVNSVRAVAQSAMSRAFGTSESPGLVSLRAACFVLATVQFLTSLTGFGLTLFNVRATHRTAAALALLFYVSLLAGATAVVEAKDVPLLNRLQPWFERWYPSLQIPLGKSLSYATAGLLACFLWHFFLPSAILGALQCVLAAFYGVAHFGFEQPLAAVGLHMTRKEETTAAPVAVAPDAAAAYYYYYNDAPNNYDRQPLMQQQQQQPPLENHHNHHHHRSRGRSGSPSHKRRTRGPHAQRYYEEQFQTAAQSNFEYPTEYHRRAGGCTADASLPYFDFAATNA